MVNLFQTQILFYKVTKCMRRRIQKSYEPELRFEKINLQGIFQNFGIYTRSSNYCQISETGEQRYVLRMAFKLWYRADGNIRHMTVGVMYQEMKGFRYPRNHFNLYSRNISFRIDLFRCYIKHLKQLIKSGNLSPDERQQCLQNLAYTKGRLLQAEKTRSSMIC